MVVSEGQTEAVSSSEQVVRTEEENQDEQGTANTSHVMSDLKSTLYFYYYAIVIQTNAEYLYLILVYTVYIY